MAKPTPRRISVRGPDELNASRSSVTVSSATYSVAWRRAGLLNIGCGQTLAEVSLCPNGRAVAPRSARCVRVRLSDEGALHDVKLFECLAGSARDTRKRIVGDVNGHLGGLADPPIETLQQCTATGEHDALVHDVRDELRRSLLDCVLDRIDDLLHRLLDGLADLLGRDRHGTRQASEQITAAHRDRVLVVVARIGRADGNLDVLCRAFAEQQVVLAPTVGNDVLVELVT